MVRLPVDSVVDLLRAGLAQRGCTRIILLGSCEDMNSGALRSGLARRGLQVLVPPAAERAWIASLAEGAAAGAPAADVGRLRRLLLDGMEHGVEAIAVAEPGLQGFVEACDLGVPLVVATPPHMYKG